MDYEESGGWMEEEGRDRVVALFEARSNAKHFKSRPGSIRRLLTTLL